MDNFENNSSYQMQMQKLIQEFNSLSFCVNSKISCIKPIEEIYDKDQQSLVVNNLEIEVDVQKFAKTQLIDSTQSGRIEEEKENNIQLNNIDTKNILQKNAYQYQYLNNESLQIVIQYNKNVQALTIKKYFAKDHMKQFENEVHIINQLQNQNITLPLIQYGEENTKLYYEQYAGQKDFLMLQKSQIKIQVDGFKNAMNYFFLKLFKKLELLHSLGFAHSCIKPQNIVIGFDNEPYFIDFGGCVQLDDFKNYLRYLTPIYNLNKYYEKMPDGSIIKSYQFTNKEEVIECDRMQLSLSFLYVTRCINSITETFFKQKKFNQLFTNGQQDILKILIEQPNQYNNILNQISNQKINIDEINKTIEQFKDILIVEKNDNNHVKKTTAIMRRINQYSITMIDVLVDKFGHLKIQAEHSDIYIVSLSLKYRMLYTILYYYYSYQNLNEIIQKNLIVIVNVYKNKNYQPQLLDMQLQNTFINQNSYQQQLTDNILSQSNEFTYELQIEYQEKYSAHITYNDIMQLYFLKQLKQLYLNSQKTNKLINKIDILVHKITKQIQRGQLQDILFDCYILAQQKILDKLLFHTRYPIHHLCKYFRDNKFTVTLYKLICDKIDFFNQIDGFSQQQINFEIRLVNCQFKESLISQIMQLVNIDFLKFSFHFQISNSQENCVNKVEFQSSLQTQFDSKNKEKQQKCYIQIVFIEEHAISQNIDFQNETKVEIPMSQEVQMPLTEVEDTQMDSKKIISEINDLLYDNLNNDEQSDTNTTDKQFNSVFKKCIDSLLVSLRRQLRVSQEFEFLMTGKQFFEQLQTQFQLNQQLLNYK